MSEVPDPDLNADRDSGSRGTRTRCRPPSLSPSLLSCISLSDTLFSRCAPSLAQVVNEGADGRQGAALVAETGYQMSLYDWIDVWLKEETSDCSSYSSFRAAGQRHWNRKEKRAARRHKKQMQLRIGSGDDEAV